MSIDDSELTEAIQNNLDDVIDLFVAQRITSTTGIDYVSHTNKTEPGSYNVSISQAAEQGYIVGSTGVLETGLGQDETLTITELTTGTSVIVELDAGDNIDDIVNKVNDQLQIRPAQVLTSATANTIDGTTPIVSGTTFGEIYGANVSNEDTITITGTDHDGNEVSGTFTVTDVSTTTLSDLLNGIENAFSGEVTASVDSDGKLVFTDGATGESDLSLELTYNGEGALDFGAIEITTQGRYELPITASSEDGKLKLTHDNYGSDIGFSVVSDIEDSGNGLSTGIGTEAVTDYGEDVAGSINGEPASGNGQYLTGDEGNENTEGLSLLVDVTAAEIEAAGGDYGGSVVLTYGIAEQMDNLLESVTDTYDGTISMRMENIQDDIDELDERILDIENRVEMEQERLERTFIELERAMSEMRAQGNFLLAQISSLNSNSSQQGNSLFTS
jgi:flagellar hook-associated protein 2